MSTTMVARKPVSVIHHEAKVYRPNRKGDFDIDDGHVEAMRPHGLETKAEAEQRAADATASAGKDAEIAKLRARIDELEGSKK